MKPGPAAAAESLRAKINAFPRLLFCHLPTPLERLENLSRKLNLNLYVKRDDQTGLAMGGNKARKLEFILADALTQGADAIITWAGMQSNWCRQVAAAARHIGIEPYLILFKRPGLPAELDGNVLINEICGADVSIFDLPEGSSIQSLREVREYVEHAAERARKAGKKPYIAPIGGSLMEGSMNRPWGAFGYVNAMLELVKQAEQQQVRLDYLVFATSSGGTHAGLVAGVKLLSLNTKIIGIAVSDSSEKNTEQVIEISNATLRTFGIGGPSMTIERQDVLALDEYVGEGYGILNRTIVETVGFVGQNEGILLDPVYTGKAMTGLIDLQQKGYFGVGKNVVFLHTGGAPALFPYRDCILKYLGPRSRYETNANRRTEESTGAECSK